MFKIIKDCEVQLKSLFEPCMNNTEKARSKISWAKQATLDV